VIWSFHWKYQRQTANAAQLETLLGKAEPSGKRGENITARSVFPKVPKKL